MRKKTFGLLGSITHDEISLSTGESYTGIGGILYPSAVLCGLGQRVLIHAHLARSLSPLVKEVTRGWEGINRKGLIPVQGEGNRVVLFYPEDGEREEVLKSRVPPIPPGGLLEDSNRTDLMIFTANSGMDIDLPDWRLIVHACCCPVWLDIHSLVLAPVLGANRNYRAFPQWRDWAENVAIVQANLKEVACMLGQPEAEPGEKELLRFGDTAIEMGVTTIFVTLGRGGVYVRAGNHSDIISSGEADRVVDTTGCGDVFCAGAAAGLAHGLDPFDSARFGVKLAFRAVGVQGVNATYEMARNCGLRL